MPVKERLGLRLIRAFFQSKSLDKSNIDSRAESLNRRGFALRSWVECQVLGDEMGEMDLADTAFLLCLTKRHVQNLVELGLPKHGSGKGSYFVWAEVFQWYLAYKIDCAKRPEGPGSPEDEVNGESYDMAFT